MQTKLSLLAAIAFTTLVSQAQEWAKPRLEKSPRHLEFITVKNGAKEIKSFIAYPEVKEKATAVLVIHEIFGLSDWVRGMTDQFAEAGYIAIAPDLLSGKGPNGGGTAELGGDDGARRVIGTLDPNQVTSDLNALIEYAAKLPACNGKVVVAGFCWGGAQTFRLATNNKNIKAGFVFYGTPPDKAEDVARINCPIYGFYASDDARITATVPDATALMKQAGKTYEPVIYENAGHGFMRAGEDPNGTEPKKKAREQGWVRLKELLKKI